MTDEELFTEDLTISEEKLNKELDKFAEKLWGILRGVEHLRVAMSVFEPQAKARAIQSFLDSHDFRDNVVDLYGSKWILPLEEFLYAADSVIENLNETIKND